MERGHRAGASVASLLKREIERERERGRERSTEREGERVSADLREIWERTEGEGAWWGGRHRERSTRV